MNNPELEAALKRWQLANEEQAAANMAAINCLADEVSSLRKALSMTREELAVMLSMGRGGRTCLEIAERPTPDRHLGVNYLCELVAALRKLKSKPSTRVTFTPSSARAGRRT